MPAHIEFVADALLRIKAAKAQQVIEPPMLGRFVDISKTSYTLLKPGMPVEVNGRGRIVTRPDGQQYLIEQLPIEVEPAQDVVGAVALIEDWARDKKKDDDDKAEKAKLRASDRFFAWLNGGHQDFARVTEPDMRRYRRYLIDEHQAGRIKEEKTAENYLTHIKALLTYAVEEQKITSNPGTGVNYKGHTKPGNKYQDFIADEIALILKESRKATLPFIRWFHWLASYPGLDVRKSLRG
jgi:hypothetical protein